MDDPLYNRGEKAAAAAGLLVLAVMMLIALDILSDGRMTSGFGRTVTEEDTPDG